MYARQTTVTRPESRHKVMRPTVARNLHEAAQRIEAWREATVELARVDAGHPKLPAARHSAASRGILVGNSTERIDLAISEVDMQFDDLLREVRNYAGTRRAEAKTKMSEDDLDIGNVGKAPDRQAWTPQQTWAPQQQWHPPGIYWMQGTGGGWGATSRR